MTEEQKVQNAGGADVGRLVIAIVLVLAGIVAFYVLDSAPILARWAAVVAGLVLGLGVFATSVYGRTVIQFALDSRVELRKVVWPSQRESLTTTAVVFGFVVIGGIFFWIVDFFLALATKHLTGQGG
ncbi:MAG: preprotein translocase subunit SecE [Steroidobacteraceae bacterium]